MNPSDQVTLKLSTTYDTVLALKGAELEAWARKAALEVVDRGESGERVELLMGERLREAGGGRATAARGGGGRAARGAAARAEASVAEASGGAMPRLNERLRVEVNFDGRVWSDLRVERRNLSGAMRLIANLRANGGSELCMAGYRVLDSFGAVVLVLAPINLRLTGVRFKGTGRDPETSTV